MGMYNEVFKKCPNCKRGVGYLQIHQIVLGFGGFDLDDPDLTLDELKELRDTVYGETFYCKSKAYNIWGDESKDDEICGLSFRLLNEKQKEERERLIQELTNPEAFNQDN
jgi:hypothetical protein